MLFNRIRAVEFIGGPFDGHRQSIRLSSNDGVEVIAIPVHENVLRKLAESAPVCRALVTSVAIYELRKYKRKYHYQFLSANAPRDYDLEHHRL
mgnify:CR=1 FL=1